MEQAKSFAISKQAVWEAWKQVKSNRGAAGIDGQTIADFETDLKGNLYKLWNRMASGSDFPPAVKRVEIPKSDGGVRPLGIPTVSDRIAQRVVKRQLEPELEPELEACFHPDSHGYRPGKSALDAVGSARQRCWKYDWVLDLDIKGFFDNIDHELLLRAVKKHTSDRWVVLYVERWLKAPVAMPYDTEYWPEKGTPQGGVVSPLLANLFLHYGFDQWMRREYPAIPFERYADDAVCHCRTQEQVITLRHALEQRMKEIGLELHPVKTQIVYYRDSDRKGDYPHTQFDFLGYTFRPRRSKNWQGKHFINFTPAISNKASKAIRTISRKWRWPCRSDKSLEDLAFMFNRIVQGWINYYGRYYRSALIPVCKTLERRLVQWAMRKFKKLRGHQRKAAQWLRRIGRQQPWLFAHWRLLYGKG